MLIWIAIIVSSIWVFMDAKSIGVQKGQVTGLANLGPVGWLVCCLLLWIVAFPFYLLKRKAFKRINANKVTNTTSEITAKNKVIENSNINIETSEIVRQNKFVREGAFFGFFASYIFAPSLFGVRMGLGEYFIKYWDEWILEKLLCSIAGAGLGYVIFLLQAIHKKTA